LPANKDTFWNYVKTKNSQTKIVKT
jgi:hypothetical protein